jgi:hypothetical protein
MNHSTALPKPVPPKSLHLTWFFLLRLLRLLLVILIFILVIGPSTLAPANEQERIRAFTRTQEFDYISWIFNALGDKLAMSSLGAVQYLRPANQHALVLEYLQLVSKRALLENQVTSIYADPQVNQPGVMTRELRQEIASETTRLNEIGPVAESILQDQVSQVVSSLGIDIGGQPLPPIWYHTTPLPLALIISPRNVIRSESDISLVPDLSVDQMDSLENRISKSLDVSALVVPVGGIGVYPTMVEETSDLSWLADTIAHEWTHNYLTLHPLGLNYETSPQLRTMNETTANIVGTEVGSLVLKRFYPELVPPPTSPEPQPSEKAASPVVFNFRAEMHTTRVTVDHLLAEGKITQAEAYMEGRRQFFYQHGYAIRKLNQAYFAFYGAYADQPGGAAGEDPVGPAVRALRQRSATLADFLNKIAWMTSFKQLQAAVR